MQSNMARTQKWQENMRQADNKYKDGKKIRWNSTIISK